MRTSGKLIHLWQAVRALPQAWLTRQTLWLAAALLFLLAGAALLARRDSHFEGDQPARLAAQPAPPARVKQALGKLPLYFVENRGQLDARVAYYVQGSDKAVYFTAQGLTFVLNGAPEHLPLAAPEMTPQPISFKTNFNLTEPAAAPQRWALKLDFVGARRDVQPEGEAPTEAVFSYFKGPQAQWQTGLKSYACIVYRDLWPGIDLVYAGTVNRMKYSFVVRPGADPNQIELAYRGVSGVKLNAMGELEVRTPVGGFTDERPVSWQEVDGQQVAVTTSYALAAAPQREATVYGFTVGEYDRSRELVIDPAVFVYAGFIGGNISDRGNDIAVDSAGNVYITGSTSSAELSFPDGNGIGALPSPDNTQNGGASDAFVVKVNAAGTALVYAGYIGGNSYDFGNGIAVDNGGNAYVVGMTDAGLSATTGFPDGDGFGALTGPDTTPNGVSDAFVAKINAAGTALVYASYIGSSSTEEGYAIAVDSSGNAYVTGRTAFAQASFPDGDGFGTLPGPDQTHNHSDDAFVVKVNAAGTAFVYAGFIGGLGNDAGSDIAVDNAGNAYITGGTTSTQSSFPDGEGFLGGERALPTADQTYNGGSSDAFVVKINAAGTAFAYASYIGGQHGDGGSGVAVDGAGNAYVTGSTHSIQNTFPDGDGFGALPGPDQTFNGEAPDAYVVKINAAGTAFVYAGYIGGVGRDISDAIAVDSAGNAYIAGWTDSGQDTFPDGDGFDMTLGPDTTYNGSREDAFVAKINAAGTALIYAGYIGGGGDDYGNGIAVDGAGNAYVTGYTYSDERTFPDGDGFGTLPGPDQTHNRGVPCAFVAKISAAPAPDLTIIKSDDDAIFTMGGTGVYTITVSNATDADATTGAITVTDTLPVNLTLTSFSGAGWSCQFIGTADVTCTHAGPLAPGASLPPLTLRVNIGVNTAAQVTNTAQVATPDEVVTANNSSTITTVINCAATLSKPSQSFAANGGADSFTVQIAAGCNWTAVRNNFFINITAPVGSATGPGTVSYTVFEHFNPTPRNGTITVAGQTFVIAQGARFNDVPVGQTFYTEIGKLSARGVTQGCGGGNFCPGDDVTREQMAAFIIRALGDFNPPPPAMQRFADVLPSNIFYAFIEQLAVRQITLGCGGGNYCPTNPVTREQMAAFIIRALHPPGYVPPTPAAQRFADVPPSNLFYAHIEELAVRGITLGCGGGNYCPTDNVTRAQMAAFLVRAFGL